MGKEGKRTRKAEQAKNQVKNQVKEQFSKAIDYSSSSVSSNGNAHVKTNSKSSEDPNAPYSLWNNDMVKAAMNQLSPEDLQKYKEIGEAIYKDVDYEKSEIKNIPAPMSEALAYVEESLKSGLHPSMLDDNEKEVLKGYYGDDWYKKWGYVEGDLTDIVTVKIE